MSSAGTGRGKGWCQATVPWKSIPRIVSHYWNGGQMFCFLEQKLLGRQGRDRTREKLLWWTSASRISQPVWLSWEFWSKNITFPRSSQRYPAQARKGRAYFGAENLYSHSQLHQVFSITWQGTRCTIPMSQDVGWVARRRDKALLDPNSFQPRGVGNYFGLPSSWLNCVPV